MDYHSTRGAGEVSAARALLLGAAPDGGLYVPHGLPGCLDLLDAEMDYAGLAGEVFIRLLQGMDPDALRRAALAAYGNNFESQDITPLVEVGDSFVLELFHGPTAAFKDLALQALPRLMAPARDELDPQGRYAVLAATSGDTGSAAMSGYAGVPGFEVLVYYPAGGVSAVQLRQMQAMPGSNVRAVGIRGDFDAAQAGVKAALATNPARLPPRVRLSSANSINIGRLVPQVVYYIQALRRLKALGRLKPGQRADFIVPTGNFGDVYAGFLARRLGLPIGRLVVACNANRVLADFLETGVYDRRRELTKTLSPSMDILVSSNLERLLYDMSRQDTGKVAAWMADLREQGVYRVDGETLARIREVFLARASDDNQALGAIRRVWLEHRYLMDPHTAAAWLAQDALVDSQNPRVVLATASPFKFPEAMLRALGQAAPEEPERLLNALSGAAGQAVPVSLQGLMDRPPIHTDVIDSRRIAEDALGRTQAW